MINKQTSVSDGLTNRLLDSFLSPFTDAERVKPREMLYIANEVPPASTVVLAGIQHTMVAMMLVVYMVITGTDIGLSQGPLRNFVALGVLVMGFGTILNGLTTRVSAGHLLVLMPGTINMMVFIPVANTFGLGAAAGGVFIAGIAVFILGRFLPRLRVLFPPEVMGVLLLLLGMSLLPGGIRRCTGMTAGTVPLINFGHVIIAAVTLGTITSIAVWASERIRCLGLIIGAAAGLLAASLTGHFGPGEWAAVSGQPFFSMPVGEYRRPDFTWLAGAVVPLVFTILIGSVDEMGCGVVIDRMNNDQWRRADLPMIGRLLNGAGICTCLSGLMGTLPLGSSSANLGLAHATGVAARRVGVAAGIMLMITALLPQITMFIIMLPPAVMGAIMIYTAAYMMVSGAELVLSRLLNARRRATVGLSLAAGIAVMLVPELTASAPFELKPLLSSGLIVGTSLAIALTLLFRIGVVQSSEILLDGPNVAEQATRFLEDCGSNWGARRDVIMRAGMAAGEALEALLAAGLIKGRAKLTAGFDEYRLSLTLDYPGRAWQPADTVRVNWDEIMENDDSSALDDVMANVSSGIIRNLADHAESDEKNGQAQLRLDFEH